MNDKELFENNCLPLFWLEDEETFEQPQIVPRKDMQTLLAELEDIKNKIENLSEKEWHLAKLMKFYNARLTTQ